MLLMCLVCEKKTRWKGSRDLVFPALSVVVRMENYPYPRVRCKRVALRGYVVGLTNVRAKGGLGHG